MPTKKLSWSLWIAVLCATAGTAVHGVENGGRLTIPSGPSGATLCVLNEASAPLPPAPMPPGPPPGVAAPLPPAPMPPALPPTPDEVAPPPSAPLPPDRPIPLPPPPAQMPPAATPRPMLPPPAATPSMTPAAPTLTPAPDAISQPAAPAVAAPCPAGEAGPGWKHCKGKCDCQPEGRPFGYCLHAHMRTQVLNGLANQLALYQYDFCEGIDGDPATLNRHGQQRLRDVARLMQSSNLHPLVIEPSVGKPALDAARRVHVLTAMANSGYMVPEEWVVVAVPDAPGLSGLEAVEIYKNHLRQTQQATMPIISDQNNNSGANSPQNGNSGNH